MWSMQISIHVQRQRGIRREADLPFLSEKALVFWTAAPCDETMLGCRF